MYLSAGTSIQQVEIYLGGIDLNRNIINLFVFCAIIK